VAEPAVILLSGGIDSAVCLWWAKARGWELYALTVNHHPLDHDMGMVSARALAERAGVAEHKLIELPLLKELGDLRLNASHPLAGRSDLPRVYMPAKNLVFYGLAAAWAEELGADKIIGGHNAGDARLFPDSSPSYLSRLNKLINAGLASASVRPVRLLTPVIGLRKSQVIRLGLSLGVPLDLTWSCHERGRAPCGRCDGCLARRAAFEELGLKDPALRAQA
jgi:7-cyano-7-deazaguanine synthase